MSQFLIENGVYVGNALAAATGLVFTLGIPSRADVNERKHTWLIFWYALTLGNVYAAVDAPAATSVLALPTLAVYLIVGQTLNLQRASRGRSWARGAWAVGMLVFVLVCAVSFEEPDILSPYDRGFSWLAFVWLAWLIRLEHVDSSVFLLGYANLQLPGAFIERGATDLILLIAAKLSLIAALYRLFGLGEGEGIRK